MSANGTLINAQKVVNLSKSHKKECWRLFRNPLHVDCFGEAIELAKQKLDQKNVYFTNPAFDK